MPRNSPCVSAGMDSGRANVSLMYCSMIAVVAPSPTEITQSLLVQKRLPQSW